MYKEKTINILTGEETYRDYSDEEIANVEAAQLAAQAEAEALTVKESARQAILDRLGLTADEAALLLGAN